MIQFHSRQEATPLSLRQNLGSFKMGVISLLMKKDWAFPHQVFESRRKSQLALRTFEAEIYLVRNQHRRIEGKRTYHSTQPLFCRV